MMHLFEELWVVMWLQDCMLTYPCSDHERRARLLIPCHWVFVNFKLIRLFILLCKVLCMWICDQLLPFSSSFNSLVCSFAMSYSRTPLSVRRSCILWWTISYWPKSVVHINKFLIVSNCNIPSVFGKGLMYLYANCLCSFKWFLSS